MERELTVKVNYVLGDQSAFAQAGSAAASVSQKVQSTFASAARDLGLSVDGARRSLGSLLSGGIGTLAGAGVLSGIAGGISSDLIMAKGAGGGMRGHGLSGLNDSFWGMVTGRSTKEAITDQKMWMSSQESALAGIRTSGLDASLAVTRSSMFKPITEVDPIKRLQEERGLLAMQRGQAAWDYKQVMAGREAALKKVDFIHSQKMDLSQEGQRAWLAGLAEADKVFLGKKQEYYQEEVQRAGQMEALNKSVFEGRKSQMRSSQMAWGAMTLAEQQSHRISLDLLKRRQKLLPEQISQLESIPEAKEMLDEYKLREGKASGHAEAMAGLKGDMGQANLRAVAMKAATGVGVDPEELLDSKLAFEQSHKLKKMLSKALAAVIDEVTANDAWLKTELM
ncbi:MAG TPA: hypothetical protein PLX97_04180, partial [Gemmatales bacterium]|nr:hypothetical protein [Gemmatales bacterium]